ncbi:MAG: transglycosylase SLT domain-containing protein [Acidobacteria bacterium]|nr:transglycosylase SLT domain-containing protein [Acidobacteriota bacterium]
MTIGSVTLPEITQTLAELQTPPSTTPPASSSAQQTQAFAATLSQAASALSASLSGGSSLDPQGLGASLGVGAGLTSVSSASAELNLISLLLSSQQSGSTSPVSGAQVAAISPSSGPQTAPVTSAPGPVSPDAARVVSLASSLEGTPYVWGGTTPAGFDCSGLVQYVYGQLGINVPRTSQEQATVGTPVSSLAAAQPGDLLFFAGSDGTASSPGHVGIYIGNGQMIAAPYTGTVVQQQPVSGAGTVVAIRRILPEPPATNTVMGQVTVPAQFVSTIESAAAANGIPASLLAALVSHESGFNPNAMSSAGAEGIAQFMPATAQGMGVNPFDSTSAINGAAKLLGAYSSRFGSYANALAAYNAGPTAVARYGGVPPYPETQAYVPTVLALAGLGASNQGSIA